MQRICSQFLNCMSFHEIHVWLHIPYLPLPAPTLESKSPHLEFPLLVLIYIIIYFFISRDCARNSRRFTCCCHDAFLTSSSSCISLRRRELDSRIIHLIYCRGGLLLRFNLELKIFWIIWAQFMWTKCKFKFWWLRVKSYFEYSISRRITQIIPKGMIIEIWQLN